MASESLQWRQELSRRITSQKLLEQSTTLSPEERAYFSCAGNHTSPPLAVTEYYLSLLKEGPRDPLRKQCIPDVREFTVKPYESADPLYEKSFSPIKRMVHRYRDRVLILVSDRCALYCRHCFRRHFAGREKGFLQGDEAERIARYIRDHKEVHEIILSGGDPLMMGDEQLQELLALLEPPRPRVFRLATRMPVVLPSRITGSLIEMLSQFKPLWIVTQFNHPREITGESSSALSAFLEKGIPVLNQTVLLKEINDDSRILASLFQKLIERGVKPYYLFQGDLAAGTSHFRVPLEKAFTLY